VATSTLSSITEHSYYDADVTLMSVVVRIVASSLDGVAAGVRICELPDLPDKGDVSDWFAAGGTADDLVTHVEATPRR
jgi:hypothetical protein